MAFFDDRKFLLSHIRHSFITYDDTGMCEMVMLNETMPHHLPDEPDTDFLRSIEVETKSELVDLAQSYDIVSDMEMIGAHRRRSNTAQRLERLKKERKSQSKVKTIQWKDSIQPLTDKELADLFPFKDLKVNTNIKKTSMLSEQLNQYPSVPANPFNEYARFDGRVSEGAPTKRIHIYLTMLDSDEKCFPMEVVTLCSAKVQDLIGLICWLYTNEGYEPKLKPDISNYSLRIAEETGEVDPDFPSLNPKEPMGKFGFPVLALVENDENELENLVVTVYIDSMFSKIEAPNAQVNLQWILDQTLKKRKSAFDKSNLIYTLELLKDPGESLNLTLKLADIDAREFRLCYDEVNESEGIDDEIILPDMYAIEAPLYKSYLVNALQKLGRTAEVQLGISSKKVDITPILSKSSSKLWSWQPKAATYNIECITECEVVYQKQNTGRATFKLVYFNGVEFQSQKFEADSKTVQEIVKKLKFIMKMRTSMIRNEYALLKEQKQQRKQAN